MDEDQFHPKHGYGKLQLSVARKAIAGYHKATGDLGGTLDLMLTDVEAGTDFALL